MIESQINLQLAAKFRSKWIPTQVCFYNTAIIVIEYKAGKPLLKLCCLFSSQLVMLVLESKLCSTGNFYVLFVANMER